jgi:hypothetical protein
LYRGRIIREVLAILFFSLRQELELYEYANMSGQLVNLVLLVARTLSVILWLTYVLQEEQGYVFLLAEASFLLLSLVTGGP